MIDSETLVSHYHVRNVVAIQEAGSSLSNLWNAVAAQEANSSRSNAWNVIDQQGQKAITFISDKASDICLRVPGKYKWFGCAGHHLNLVKEGFKKVPSAAIIVLSF